MNNVDQVRAVVVKLSDPDYPERAWVACSMSESTYDIIGEEDWQAWKAKALDLCLADWRSYEIREVTLHVPQGALDVLFSAGPVSVEVVD